MIRTMSMVVAALATVSAAISTPVFAEDAVYASRTERLTDAQLDEVTGGKVDFMEHVVINNGNAVVDKGNNGNIVCVNCVPFENSGKTIVVTIVQNPQAITHCIHCPF